jgi:NAD(P)-dependent dehydrogenase (short-subunit alcohol dehydrogenase family)
MDVWLRKLTVNLTGVWLGCRAALPHMVAANGGAIVNTSSTASLYAAPGLGAYSASKGGINALTRHIATAYGRYNIRCNAVLPGATDTGHHDESFKALAIRHNAIPRMGVPDDIANAVAFLCSDEASFITGHLLLVDGGMTAHAPFAYEMDFQ